MHMHMYEERRARAARYLLMRQCGRPCTYDYMLHTETMDDEWVGLMKAIGLAPKRLPRPVNPSTSAGRGWLGATSPRTVFDEEVLEIIHRIDANMFGEFGYEKRLEPFVIE
jgi:hypothetical protein